MMILYLDVRVPPQVLYPKELEEHLILRRKILVRIIARIIARKEPNITANNRCRSVFL